MQDKPDTTKPLGLIEDIAHTAKSMLKVAIATSLFGLVVGFLIVSLSGCTAGECNDTNEDWPGIPKCAANKSPYSPYEAYIERCEANGGTYRVGQNFEPTCEGANAR